MAEEELPSRERILTYLAAHGGSVESADGRGLTSRMAKAVGYEQLSALNAILARLEREGVIVRDVRGKRTFRIALSGSGVRSRAAGAGADRVPDVAAQPRVGEPQDERVEALVASVSELRQAYRDLEGRLAALERATGEPGVPPSGRTRWHRRGQR
jgi:hypothetical protein